MESYIAAVGAAAPDLRVDAAAIAEAWGGRGRGQVAACAADEDSLTLAWAAATRALDAAGLPRSAIGGLWWGTSRPPFLEGPSHSYLLSALQLSPDASGALLSGSPHAGIDALLAARDAVASGRVTIAVVVASDAILPEAGTAYERRAGAGAVALVVTAADGPARLERIVTRARPVLDRYRGEREVATRDLYDARLIREEVFVPEIRSLVGSLDDVTVWSLPELDGRAGRALARDLGINNAADEVHEALGDAGAADALLGLALAFADVQSAGAIAHGGGRTTAVTFEVSSPVPGAERVAEALAGGRRAAYTELLRAREQLVAGGEPIPMGVPPGGAGFVRGNTELLALSGARCVACGTISTPPSVHPTCIGCGGTKLEVVPLERSGAVETFVVNQTMPPPFVAPLPLIVVDLDDGARLLVQGVGAGDDVEIGGRVRLELRRYAIERGAPIYGYKARPERKG